VEFADAVVAGIGSDKSTSSDIVVLASDGDSPRYTKSESAARVAHQLSCASHRRKLWSCLMLKTPRSLGQERRPWSSSLLKVSKVSKEAPMIEKTERCLVCLSDEAKCAHIAAHGKLRGRCGPWSLCLSCASRLCQGARGQLVCPICRNKLGPLRRALTEGADVFSWERLMR